jgi:hypothetical protein
VTLLVVNVSVFFLNLILSGLLNVEIAGEIIFNVLKIILGSHGEVDS